MDPLGFRIDWEVMFEVLVTIIIFSLFIERALSVIVEHRWFVNKYGEKGIKEFLAIIVSIVAIRYWGFDAMAIILKKSANSWPGYIITAFIVAGGSKGSVKLFHDVMGIKSKAVAAADKKRKK